MIPKIDASKIFSTLGNNSSLVPLGIKDVANSSGLTVSSYITGSGFEGKDRFIDEFGTQAIWLGGIPAYKYLLNNTLFKFAKFDSKIDPRIFKDKKITALAMKYAPSQEIKENIKNAAKRQKMFKTLAVIRFAASTVLAALTYFGLTKLRHKYTENQIKKEYMEHKKKDLSAYNKQVPFSAAFSPVQKSANPVFTGGIQDFMFDPVKNLMLVDGSITAERLSSARNPQDFLGYLIKESSTWTFMYFAGPLITKYLEKHSEKAYNKSINLDARIIESPQLRDSLLDGSLKKHIEILKNIKSDEDLYKFAVSPETNNIVIDMAKKSDIITLLKNLDKVDTRNYIDLNNLKSLAGKLEKLISQYEKSGQSTDAFITSLRNLKRSAVIKNIGACIFALGIIVPAIMVIVRKLSPTPEFQVKKDIEEQLKKS